MTAFTVNNRDIEACPKKSLSPEHYHPAGNCRCGERLRAEDAVRKAEYRMRKAEADLKAAQEWLAKT